MMLAANVHDEKRSHDGCLRSQFSCSKECLITKMYLVSKASPYLLSKHHLLDSELNHRIAPLRTRNLSNLVPSPQQGVQVAEERSLSPRLSAAV
jgi:hypothetical protein